MTRIAELTVDSPQKMTRMGRHEVATWLEKSARSLKKEVPAMYANNARWSYFAGRGKRRIATVKLINADRHLAANKERIVNWMLSRAKYLRKHGDLVARRWFTQVLDKAVEIQTGGHDTIHRPNPEPMRVAIP